MIATVGRIWEAVAHDVTRPILTAVRFNAEAATLTATDTYIAAQVPCKVEEGDESGIIPAVALKEANGKSLRIANGKAVLKLPDGERSWDLLEGAYPEAVDKVLAETPLANPIGLNAVLLQRLALALLGDAKETLVLHPTHPLKAIRVAAMRNGQGVIMPVRVPASTGEPLTLEATSFGETNNETLLRGIQAGASALQGRKGKAAALRAFRKAIAG